MFGSAILDVGIGLAFTFLAVSLIASAGTEMIASILKWRANTLLAGIKDLLNDKNFNGLALRIYNHAAVNPRANGAATGEASLTAKPSYIDPSQFANALIDITHLSQPTIQSAQVALAMAMPDPQVRKLLGGIVNRAYGNVDEIRTEIAAWFDSSMDRVSGAYKRKAQLASFLVALAIAIAMNVDALHVAKTLWQQPLLAKNIVSVTSTISKNDIVNQLDKVGLPIGWQPTDDSGQPAIDWFAGMKAFLRSADPAVLIAMIFGWIITAVAALFGAPFWFDTLSSIASLRGSGPQPSPQSSQKQN